MKRTLVLAGMGMMMLTACTLDGRSPRVGVGVSVGTPAPPPVVIAEGPRGGPPPWAPAHGRRAKERYRYYYYPASGVYFNVNTGSYFYLNGGSWQVGMSLPSAVIVDSGNYVTLDLDTDRPYLFYDEHRFKYKAPGRGNGRGHGHGKGRWKD